MLLILAIIAAILWLPPAWGIAAVIGAALFELAEMGVFVWYSKRRRATTGAEGLIGAAASVVTACEPSGQVRLEGELWNAVCSEGARPGDRVVVDRIEGLTLHVSRLHSGRG